MEQNSGETAQWRFIVALLIGGFLVYLLQGVLVPFAVAFILAYIFSPVIDRLEHHLRLPRIVAVFLLILILTVPFALLFYYKGPVLAQNVRHLAGNAPEQVTRFLTNLFGGEQISFFGQSFDVHIVAPYLITRLQDLLGAPLGVAQVAWSFVNVIMGAIFTLVVFIYFLAGGKDLIHGVVHLAPAGERERFHAFIHKIDSLIGSYLRGLAVIVVFTASVIWLVFKFVFNLPYAGFLAMTIGLLELIPLFGPIVSGVLTSIVAVANGDLLFTFKVVLFYIILRFAIDYLISPIVFGKAVTLSPVIVLFAFLAGSTLFGFLGLLFAVPVAAIFKVVLDERSAA